MISTGDGWDLSGRILSQWSIAVIGCLMASRRATRPLPGDSRPRVRLRPSRLSVDRRSILNEVVESAPGTAKGESKTWDFQMIMAKSSGRKEE
jgi:hypothetical protein